MLSPTVAALHRVLTENKPNEFIKHSKYTGLVSSLTLHGADISETVYYKYTSYSPRFAPLPEFCTLVLLVNVKALFEHSEDPVHGNRCAFGFQYAGFHEQALGLKHRFGRPYEQLCHSQKAR